MDTTEGSGPRFASPPQGAGDQARPAYSLYLHIPFCRHRCGYCDFNTYQGMQDLIAPYTQALRQEIGLVGDGGSRPQVITVFFGGGTPSLLPLPSLRELFDALRTSFVLESQVEVTLEANPGTVTAEYLSGLRGMGVNRLSFGMQSAQPQELQLLERQHTHEDTIRSMEWARRAGFENINLDLIYGLPRQSMSLWQETLRSALELHPDHLSLYALTLEHGTPLRRAVLQGKHPWPDDDQAADMYGWASEALDRAGFAQYEISNWARTSHPQDDSPGLACRHNLQYWRNLPYLGLGAGAHGFAAGVRYSDVLAPGNYIRRVGEGGRRGFPLSPAAARSETIDANEEMRQTMWLGLRLTREGVLDSAFAARFGFSCFEIFGHEIESLVEDGLLEWEKSEERIKLTPRGRLLGNRVFVEFV
ncbi:MAG: radical SAM family heme chaperone HemW [Anaerolineales bacterium]